MRIQQVRCDKCGRTLEETKHGKVERFTGTYYIVDDKDLCPTCFEELDNKGVIIDKYGFAQFAEGFEL